MASLIMALRVMLLCLWGFVQFLNAQSDELEQMSLHKPWHVLPSGIIIG